MERGENLFNGQRVYIALVEGGRAKTRGTVDYVRKTRRAGMIIHVRTQTGVEEYPACWVWPETGDQ